jgi:hypothetical protein
MSQAPIEGSLYIKAFGHDLGVSFVPNIPGVHGSTGVHACEGDEGLVTFLRELDIPQERIDGALKELRLRGDVSISPVHLAPEQIRRYGL